MWGFVGSVHGLLEERGAPADRVVDRLIESPAGLMEVRVFLTLGVTEPSGWIESSLLLMVSWPGGLSNRCENVNATANFPRPFSGEGVEPGGSGFLGKGLVKADVLPNKPAAPDIKFFAPICPSF